MKSLYLYNPENDLALAVGHRGFTPPRSALALRRAGAILPALFAAQGDFIAGEIDPVWYGRLEKTLGLGACLCTPGQTATPMPWGWSPWARKEMGQWVDDGCLPTDAQIARMQLLSHRRTSLAVARTVYSAMGLDPFQGLETNSIEQSMDMLARHTRIMAKLPYSSAGRGQQDSGMVPPREMERRLRGMIRTQGSVILEPFVEKTCDFAMLFERDGREFRFTGYSLFQTDHHGTWHGNLLLPDNEIECRLDHDRDWTTLQRKVAAALGQTATDAPLCTAAGVDMMIDTDGEIHIAEVNWRRTMGHVAHVLATRYPGATFTVLPTNALPARIINLSQPGPLVAAVVF